MKQLLISSTLTLLLLAACAAPTAEEPAPTPALPTEVAPPTPDTPQQTETPTPTATPTAIDMPCFQLLTPEDGAKLPAIGRVTFAWEAMPGAARYQLEIILPSNQSVLFESDTTSRSQYIEAFRMGGKYQWSVTAFGSDGAEICATEPFAFEKPEYVPPPESEKNDSGGDDDGGDGGSDGGGTGPPPTIPGT